MGSILVSILFGFVGFVLMWILKDVYVSSDMINRIIRLIMMVLSVASILGVLIGIVIGVFVAHGGYTNPEIVSTLELVSLRDDVTSKSNSGLI